jgi:hypothetical protein
MATARPTARLVDLATTIRSKNAGIYRVTFDVLFDDWSRYELVRDARVLTPESMAELFGVTPDEVVGVVNHDAGQGIKITLQRPRPSGNPGDPDILACQQHAPLYDVLVPLDP